MHIASSCDSSLLSFFFLSFLHLPNKFALSRPMLWQAANQRNFLRDLGVSRDVCEVACAEKPHRIVALFPRMFHHDWYVSWWCVLTPMQQCSRTRRAATRRNLLPLSYWAVLRDAGWARTAKGESTPRSDQMVWKNQYFSHAFAALSRCTALCCWWRYICRLTMCTSRSEGPLTSAASQITLFAAMVDLDEYKILISNVELLL